MDRPVHVVCTRGFTAAHLEQLRAVSPRLKIDQRLITKREELPSVLTPEIEVLYAIWPPASLENLPNLRWFQCRSAGMNAVMGTPIWNDPRIQITSASGLHGITMAEYTLGMMIALARDFLGYLSFQRRSEWPKAHHARFPGRELRGATVVIFGYGSIGREVGRQCQALGMRVIAVKRNPSQRAHTGYNIPGTGDPEGKIPERWIGPDQLDEVLPQAEYVVVTAALTDESRGLIGEAQLRRMRPDSFVINVGRGGVVDETALASALRERRIGGAALDVFTTEPLPATSPLWGLDNAILSPHISGVTPNFDDHMVPLFAENLRRYLAGEPMFNLVDRGRGY